MGGKGILTWLLLYSTVGKGHKIKAKQSNGDYLGIQIVSIQIPTVFVLDIQDAEEVEVEGDWVYAHLNTGFTNSVKSQVDTMSVDQKPKVDTISVDQKTKVERSKRSKKSKQVVQPSAPHKDPKCQTTYSKKPKQVVEHSKYYR